jgi:hypothetical protein
MVKVPAISMIVLALIISAGCEKTNPDMDGYRILSGAAGTLSFVDSIGTGFSTALDSLIILRELFIDDDYYIEEVELEVDFPDASREFKGIKFLRPGNHTLIFSMSDVLDSNGNYYYIIWYPD